MGIAQAIKSRVQAWKERHKELETIRHKTEREEQDKYEEFKVKEKYRKKRRENIKRGSGWGRLGKFSNDFPDFVFGKGNNKNTPIMGKTRGTDDLFGLSGADDMLFGRRRKK